MAPETSFFQNPGYKRSFTDVPLEGDKIATQPFIEACESLTVIFEYLSAAFSVVSKDLNGNITVSPQPVERVCTNCPGEQDADASSCPAENQDTLRGGS